MVSVDVTDYGTTHRYRRVTIAHFCLDCTDAFIQVIERSPAPMDELPLWQEEA